jgi:AAA+ superfamily predicted ATPase
VSAERDRAALLAARDALAAALRANVPASCGDVDPSSALARIAATFALTPFERDVLALCAAVELDAATADLVAEMHGDPARRQLTFALVLARLAAPHWDAIVPDAPLRRYRLVELEPHGLLAETPVRIAERVLHALLGVDGLDERLAARVTPLRARTGVVPSHADAVERAVAAWSADAPWPCIALLGDDAAGKDAIAAEIAARLGLRAYRVAAAVIPDDAVDREAFARLWEREAALVPALLAIDVAGDADPARREAVAAIAERLRGALVINCAEAPRPRGRAVLAADIALPLRAEQRTLWRDGLGERGAALNGKLDRVTAQFHLDAASIGEIGDEIAGAPDLGAALWSAARRRARPRLDDLAQRVATRATFDDLVLPPEQTEQLRQIVAHVRGRTRVYDDWGFARDDRGLGVAALFHGPSGTGKTLAAEVIARELDLDCYRVDLSAVVSKYIGETERNLRRVFDAAEAGGAVLLFDEADALWGRRTEVRDSHDRYANIEVSYLLQRMESYRGLAILTTNMRQAIDGAFMRRLRFVVDFPFPGRAQRAAIWRAVFPPQTPLDGVDFTALAQLNVAGGGIRNIALHAAFLAADDGVPVRAAHLLRAARAEYAKNDQTLAPTELAGWAT